ncbi:MAG: MGH1-like glycoside hydrolase domain-containing protein [Solirubrobacterales bacterium]
MTEASTAGVITDDLRDQVLGIAEETLRGNWIDGERNGVHYGYSRPSPLHYPWQWYWDSCFHAIVWRRFDRARAESELRSLLAGGSDDGFIGHTIFWHRHVDWQRRWTYNVTSRTAPNTSTIQPPLLAWAWRIAVGDPATEPRIAAHHRWLEENRDLDGDGLLWIVQPDESGLDSSSKFDAIWGLRAHARPLFPFLIARNRRLDWDVRRVLDAGGPVLCEVVTNVLWCLARIAAGEPSITPVIIERLWDERRGLFLDLARGEVAREGQTDPAGGDRRVRVSTWSALAPLALPDLPEEIARRLVEEHLLDQRKYWLPFPPTSVSVEEPSFEPRKWKGTLRRLYWRGPTWINSAWLIWIGLLRHGYDPEALEMTKRLADAVANERLREFYEPYSGEGLGARDFGWSSLIAELVDPDPAAPASYL